MDTPPASEDLLTLRLTPGYLRRAGKADGFEAAVKWLPEHTNRRFIRSKDQLDVQFEDGPAICLAVTEVGLFLKCSCGRDQLKCGHAAAGGLAWLERDSPPGGPFGLWRMGDADIEIKQLHGVDVQGNVCAGEKAAHAVFRAARKRLMRNARLAPSGVDLGLFRVVLEMACGPEEADTCLPGVFFTGIDDAFDEVRQLTEHGDPHAAVEILEYGMECFRDMLMLLPAHRKKVVESLANILNAYRIACQRARINPIRAARWLALAYPVQVDALPDEILKTFEPILGRAGTDEAIRCHKVTRPDLRKLRDAGFDIHPMDV